ncbi:MAG: trypsin-like serine protease [Pseudomonadota bacterium]
MSKKLIGGLVAAFLLTACDQVRLPSAEAPEPATDSMSETATTETLEEAPGETLTASEEPEPGIDELTIVDPAEDIGPAPVEAPPVLKVTDLAAINAQLCGLPIKPLDDSLTLAEITGAEPADPDLFGTATINGVTASLTDFPGLVKMEPREFLPSGGIASGHCGATRIAENWFITAAHCLDEDYDEVSLVVGSETLSSPLAKRVNASSSVCHAAYGGAGNSYVNDIALVRVDDTVLPELARLPIAKFGATTNTLVPFNYAEANMAGWGLTAFRGSLSDTLLSATLIMTGTGPAAIGVASKEGSGPCVGDSGGPLYVTEPDGTQTVVGVLSVVEQNLDTRQFCEGDYGARYTNLQGYGDWIEGVIATCENGLGLCGF